MLAAPRYVGTPEPLLHAALEGRLCGAPGEPALQRDRFLVLDVAATEPRRADAEMLCACIESSGQARVAAEVRERAVASFRTDLYQRGVGQRLDGAGTNLMVGS